MYLQSINYCLCVSSPKNQFNIAENKRWHTVRLRTSSRYFSLRRASPRCSASSALKLKVYLYPKYMSLMLVSESVQNITPYIPTLLRRVKSQKRIKLWCSTQWPRRCQIDKYFTFMFHNARIYQIAQRTLNTGCSAVMSARATRCPGEMVWVTSQHLCRTGEIWVKTQRGSRMWIKK